MDSNSNDSTVIPIYYWEPIENKTILAFAVLGMILVTLAVIIGNVLVITAFFQTRKLRTISNVYLVSLAFVDLSFGSIMLPMNILNSINGKWSFGKEMCKFWVTFNVLVANASVFHICLIAFDRYSSVTQGVDYIMKQTLRKVLFSIGLTLLLAFILAIPPVLNLFPSWLEDFYSPWGSCHLCIDMEYALPICIITFVLPSQLLCYWNYKIYRGIKTRTRGSRSHSARMRTNIGVRCSGADSLDGKLELETTEDTPSVVQDEEKATMVNKCGFRSDTDDTGDVLKKVSFSSTTKSFLAEKRKISVARERKSAILLAVIIVAFCLCWTPFTLLYFLTPFLKRSQYPSSHFNMLTGWLGYSNSAFNPIIYTVFNPEFRLAFKRILTCVNLRRRCF